MIKVRRAIPAAGIKLVIWDLDGTLVDSRLDLANSVNAMLRHLGRPELPCEVISTYIGDGAPMLVRRALGDPDDERVVNDALAYFLGWYREHKLDNTYVYAGVQEALQSVAAGNSGRAMAVLTNKPVVPSRAIVDALGLGPYFSQVYGGDSFHTKKPDPQGALQLLQEFGAQPEATVIVGDSHVDVLTGRNAGIFSLGVSYGLAPHSFEDAAPDVLVDTPAEVAAVLEHQR